MKLLLSIFILFLFLSVQSQNPLNIPPSMTGSNFDLTIQSGTSTFYTGKNTPTYGINGVWLAPTIIVNKDDSITLNVRNNLSVKSTLHWHGLHVAPQNDGGPHQIILPNTTWSPSFKVRNNAGTFWYHPHGAGQTDPQVSKGLAGFFIIKDAQESALALPRTYGLDDIPVVVQSKAFDELQQIAIATDMDTAIFVNGTLNPYLNVPAQVVRIRLLNGSSLRSYNFGLSNGQTFYQIATDGGMLDSSYALTRIRMSPGERAEILINFSSMVGQSLFLKCYNSELSTGIYGANSVGIGTDTIPEYKSNFLNGADFNILEFKVVAKASGAITNIPQTLIPYNPINSSTVTHNRRIIFDTIRLLPAFIPNRAEGPFGINNQSFDMDVFNDTILLNATEIWTLVNNTLVAHPFHIHDIQFNVIERSGKPITRIDKGWKDVVLVMPKDSVKVIAKFEDFANETIPYMYHCHLLHHEDDGMMGSFIVKSSSPHAAISEPNSKISIYPNPSNNFWQIKSAEPILNYTVSNNIGQVIIEGKSNQEFLLIPNHTLHMGFYILSLTTHNKTYIYRLIKD